ncbi:MAG TPA: cupin domain-containing protein [Rhodanobacteraceae bacterium]|nr:cupin domain-containing protein [Rhodanobacteraceae bacterium]
MTDTARHRRTFAMEVRARRDQPLGMPPARFLREYWQKHPLLIRGAGAGFKLPLTPEDLAGLTCEDGVLARLVLHDRRADHWRVETGPFAETRFASLPRSHWTLLVQDVDKWDADVAALLDDFDFLPRWRIDDVMVSYAADGGGVGPHVDQYDVFLLQGLGVRRWRISLDPVAPQALREDVDLKMLADFTATHDWRLHPGDMLYLPPGIAHDGVAEGDCMTFSVGMRAPAQSELLLDLAEHLVEHLPETQRYADPDLAPARTTGEIDAPALLRVRQALGALAAALSSPQLADWFGRFITRYRAAQIAAPPLRPTTSAAFAAALKTGRPLLRHPWSRCAWTRHGHAATLYVAGLALPCSRATAIALCDGGPIPPGVALALPAADRQCLRDLLNEGHLRFGPRPRGHR